MKFKVINSTFNFRVAMFLDLHLQDSDFFGDGDPHMAREQLAQAVRLGWSGVAIGHTVTGSLSERDK